MAASHVLPTPSNGNQMASTKRPLVRPQRLRHPRGARHRLPDRGSLAVPPRAIRAGKRADKGGSYGENMGSGEERTEGGCVRDYD
eukprot:UN06283